MSEKPSYLGLLNAISLGESEAEGYLNAWAATTSRDDVRKVIATVALREGEHGKAFAKRICELGYSLMPKPSAGGAEKMAVASSTTLTDREKFEKLKLGRSVPAGERDIFSSFFDDRSMDIPTSTLMGRYVAEERDSNNMLRACYEQLCAEEQACAAGQPGTVAINDPGTVAASLEPLAAQLARIEALLEKLVAAQ